MATSKKSANQAKHYRINYVGGGDHEDLEIKADNRELAMARAKELLCVANDSDVVLDELTE